MIVFLSLLLLALFTVVAFLSADTSDAGLQSARPETGWVAARTLPSGQAHAHH